MMRRLLTATTAAVLALGLTACAAGTTESAPAATPAPTSSASALQADGFQDPARPDSREAVAGLTPERIRIPSIGVDAGLEDLHRDADGVLDSPEEWADAGWYADGVVPGGIGPAVVAGHLDTTKREAVFVHLDDLVPGDRIEVQLSDGSVRAFAVDRSLDTSKSAFPTAAVYGPTPDAQLRLITCNRPYDEAAGHYANNLVVFATAVA